MLKSDTTPTQRQWVRGGVGYGATAYLIWGLSPFYFRLIRSISADEILAHRVIWSAALLAVFLLLQGRWAQVKEALRQRGTVLSMFATALLLAVNWFTFIYCVTHQYLLQSSLGYFIAPLLSMTLGMILLRERVRPLQTVSIALAAVGIGLMMWTSRTVPTLALILAVSGSLYGLLRKVSPILPLVGGLIETAVLLPLAVPYALWLLYRGMHSTVGIDWNLYALLPFTALVTGLPLLLFAVCARRLKLTTIGFLQYITPTCHFLLALLFPRLFTQAQPLSIGQWLTFGMIWTALALYSLDSLRGQTEAKAQMGIALEG